MAKIDEMIVRISADTAALRQTLQQAEAATSASVGRLSQIAKTAADRINESLRVKADFGGAGRAADIEAYGRSLDGLRAKFNPLFAIHQRYEADIEEINQAHRIGAISLDERAAALTRLAAAMKQQVQTFSATDAAGAKAAGGIGLAGHQMTNLSYQIQDVIVQLAGGQNPLLIMIQQGPQAAGAVGGFAAAWALVKTQIASSAAALGTFRGAMVATGIGAVVAAVGLLVSRFVDLGNETRRLDDARQALRGMLDDARRAERGLFGLSEAQRLAAQSLIQYERLNTIKKLKDDVRELGEVADDAFGGWVTRLTDQIGVSRESNEAIYGQIATINDLWEEYMRLADAGDVIGLQKLIDANRDNLQITGEATAQWRLLVAAIEAAKRQIAAFNEEEAQVQYPQIGLVRLSPVRDLTQPGSFSESGSREDARQAERIASLREEAEIRDLTRRAELAEAEGLADIAVALTREIAMRQERNDLAQAALVIYSSDAAARERYVTDGIAQFERYYDRLAALQQAQLVRSTREQADLTALQRRAEIAEANGAAETAAALRRELAIRQERNSLMEAALVLYRDDAAARERYVTDGIAQFERYYDATSTDNFRRAASYIEGVFTSAFDTIGDSITRAFADGSSAALDFGDIGKAVISELMQAFIELAAINPLKNALFGGNATTLADVGGLLGSLLGGSGHGTTATSLGVSAGPVRGSLAGAGDSGFWSSITSLLGFAKGDAFEGSRSLSSYSNGIYSTPQFFAFAKGAGVFGEAGPEAIMPLVRAPDGNLGVRSMGTNDNGGMQVTINNYSGSEVEARQVPDGRGGRRLEVTIGEAAAGEATRAGSSSSRRFGQAYGLRPRVTTR